MLVTFTAAHDWDWLTDAEIRRAALHEARLADAERRRRDRARLAGLRVVGRGSTGREDEDGGEDQR